MPYNGSGTFNRLYSWVVDAANSVNISSSRTDAEMNGFAAGLTNCITRDGQSPPSADTPWGGKKIANLGTATVGTDALNMATGDGRYLLASSVVNLTLTGALNAATGAFSGNVTVGGTLGVTGLLTASGNARINGTGGTSTLIVDDHTNTSGASIQFIGNGGTTPNKTIRAVNGQFRIANNAFNADIFTLDDTGNATFAGTLLATGLITGNAGFSGTTLALSGAANIAALTATGALGLAGALTTGTAPNSVGYLGTPQTIHVANYTFALGDQGTDQTFNAATLTATIPANASVAFPIGAIIVGTNLNASPLTIAITTDTLLWSGTTTTGSRTIGQNGEFRLRKVAATTWLITGTAMS